MMDFQLIKFVYKILQALGPPFFLHDNVVVEYQSSIENIADLRSFLVDKDKDKDTIGM